MSNDIGKNFELLNVIKTRYNERSKKRNEKWSMLSHLI